MKNSECKKVLSVLSLYIEDKLDDEEKFFVETHLFKCSDCYKKYLEMKSVIKNLHFEYEKLKDEFNRIESNNTFNIREYENFYNNISPYIDDELCYDDSIKFRKYLVNSKTARTELANAYGLRNNIKEAVNRLKNNTNINFSKKIIKQLKKDYNDPYETMYKKAGILLFIMLSMLIILSAFSLSMINKANAKEFIKQPIKTFEFPNDEDFIEFIFDENHQALLTAK